MPHVFDARHLRHHADTAAFRRVVRDAAKDDRIQSLEAKVALSMCSQRAVGRVFTRFREAAFCNVRGG
jgi:hypothetical protein